ncbi:thiamine diphosphate-binding protein [Schizophyllum amplum]|uniref:Thiamine diphosphate-binding protein n=1 Tax=Schizophyllum amplum TaxID=97359 RepID=A0A550CJ36_9AGAR|nr:thiamine diphosphate-binding protein [Auriculariopsis ampla]
MASQGEAATRAEADRLKLELESLKEKGGVQDTYIGSYLLERLVQLGVKYIFGVPGDFNLGFLDLVEDHPHLEWVGNCNELNAAYAADGYARVKERSLGVVITTFGVGELSAMNGIAGAFSEMVPVLHIVGVPSTAQQSAKPMLHHTLGDGRYDAYEKAAQQFTIAQADLFDVQTAASEIDRVITSCIVKARPAYLTLPTDIAYKRISSDRLKTPLSSLLPVNESAAEAHVIEEIERLVKAADDSVVVLVDACAIRHDVRQEVDELIKKTGFPVFAAPMGKTAVSEQYERYGGIYVGTISRPAVREKIESAKLILSIGALKSDFNTGNFTYSIPTAQTIELHSDHTKIQFAVYHDIGMKQLLPKLSDKLKSLQPRSSKIEVTPFKAIEPKDSSDVISHTWLWPRVSKFLRPKDVVVAETGTSSFGVLDVPFPDTAVFVSQILWGSIGWTVGSTLGAALAAKELQMNRTILFIGDGSIQLTVQELSAMLRSGLTPIIFLLNNSGYTIERFLHGKTRKYNDIANWKWTQLLDVLGGGEVPSRSYTVHNRAEMDKLLDDEEFAKAGQMQLVEIMMDKFDAPPALMAQAELSGKTNAYVANDGKMDNLATAS